MTGPATAALGCLSRRPRLDLVVPTLWLAAACAAPGGLRSEFRDPNLIPAAEIAEMRRAGVRDLYELVDRRRPRWLDTRSNRSLRLETVILVYHNETRLGGTDALRGYPLLSVTSVRYVTGPEAGLLPGAGSMHVEGAIIIRTDVQPTDTGSPPPMLRRIDAIESGS